MIQSFKIKFVCLRTKCPLSSRTWLSALTVRGSSTRRQRRGILKNALRFRTDQSRLRPKSKSRKKETFDRSSMGLQAALIILRDKNTTEKNSYVIRRYTKRWRPTTMITQTMSTILRTQINSKWSSSFHPRISKTSKIALARKTKWDTPIKIHICKRWHSQMNHNKQLRCRF